VGRFTGFNRGSRDPGSIPTVSAGEDRSVDKIVIGRRRARLKFYSHPKVAKPIRSAIDLQMIEGPFVDDKGDIILSAHYPLQGLPPGFESEGCIQCCEQQLVC